MRLITPTLWRAFPELDEFSDDLCRKFVKAVTVRWRSQAYRFVMVGSVVTATSFAVFLVFDFTLRYSERHPVLREWPDALLIGCQALIMTCVLLAGFPIALVVRDQVLRAQVRRVIRKRGACGRCGYSLLGMPVGTDLRLTCPECGTGMIVDPAVGVLAKSGPRDQEVFAYMPVAPERSRRRWRLIIKVVGWSTISVFVAALLGSGMALYVWWGI